MKDLDTRIRERREAVAAFNAGPRAEVRALHERNLALVSGLRRELLERHAPYMEYEHGYNRPVCTECTCSGMGCGADYVYWPCDTYTLARDWVDESNERLDRAETTRRDAENEAAQLRAELATVRHERDLLKEERW